MRKNNQKHCSCAFCVTVMQSCDTVERNYTFFGWTKSLNSEQISQIYSDSQNITLICFLPKTIAEMRHLKIKALRQALCYKLIQINLTFSYIKFVRGYKTLRVSLTLLQTQVQPIISHSPEYGSSNAPQPIVPLPTKWGPITLAFQKM